MRKEILIEYTRKNFDSIVIYMECQKALGSLSESIEAKEDLEALLDSPRCLETSEKRALYGIIAEHKKLRKKLEAQNIIKNHEGSSIAYHTSSQDIKGGKISPDHGLKAKKIYAVLPSGNGMLNLYGGGERKNISFVYLVSLKSFCPDQDYVVGADVPMEDKLNSVESFKDAKILKKWTREDFEKEFSSARFI